MKSSGNLFVGREVPLTELRNIFNSNRPEFVAVYVRRRVGKTLLIKEALGISGVATRVCSWIGTYEGDKAQIDLIIERKDGVLNICEIKYSSEKYTITKKYYQEFEHKLNIFLEATNTKKHPWLLLLQQMVSNLINTLV